MRLDCDSLQGFLFSGAPQPDPRLASRPSAGRPRHCAALARETGWPGTAGDRLPESSVGAGKYGAGHTARGPYDSGKRIVRGVLPAGTIIAEVVNIRRYGGRYRRGNWVRRRPAGAGSRCVLAADRGRHHRVRERRPRRRCSAIPARSCSASSTPSCSPRTSAADSCGSLAGWAAESQAGRRPFAAAGRRRDGTELALEITCSLVTFDAGTAMAVAVRDAEPPQRTPIPAAGWPSRSWTPRWKPPPTGSWWSPARARSPGSTTST